MTPRPWRWNDGPGLGTEHPESGAWVLGDVVYWEGLTAAQQATILLRFVELADPWLTFVRAVAAGEPATYPDPPVAEVERRLLVGDDRPVWLSRQTAAFVVTSVRSRAAAHHLAFAIPRSVTGDEMRSAIEHARADGWSPCPQCFGRKFLGCPPCRVCDGSGQVRVAAAAAEAA